MTDPATPPPIPAAPPTQRGSAIVPPKPTTWPNIVGVAAIVLGSLGLVLGAGGAIMSLLMPDFMMEAAPDDSMRAVYESMERFKGWMVALAVAGALLAAALIVGGAGLALRRAGARPVLLWWAAGKCVYVVAYAVVSHQSQVAQFEAMRQQQGGAGPPPMNWAMDSFALVGTIIWAMVGFSFPVFAIVWLSRAKIREEIAGWGVANSGPAGRA